MDLRQFTTTPNNFDSNDQRRTSISSMSSARSGYASSAYGGQTPNASRLTQSRYFGQAPPGSAGQQQFQQQQQQQQHQQQGQVQGQQQQHHHPQQQQGQQGPSVMGSQQNSSWLQQGVLNVTPWIEQQAQVSNSTTTLENQNFINNYGNNLNGPIQSTNFLGNQQQQSHAQLSQSMQASFDSQSTRASPTSSNILPSDAISARSVLTPNASSVVTPTSVMNPPSSSADRKLDGQSSGVDDDDNIGQNINTTPNNDSNDNDENDIDDELIPTAIVIKNIPFAIKKEQLLEVMTKLSLPLPYAFNYHFDNGVFRGLAFANFTSTDETTTVVNHLNGREIGGRKLRVEYKKMLPLQERERIEREKREKRGQLEEQHRSTSNASLASMISVASAPAGQNPTMLTPNGSTIPMSAGQLMSNDSVLSQTNLNNNNNINNNISNNNSLNNNNSVLNSERYYAPIPFVNNLPIPPQQVDFNDPETLEYYSQLLFFRDDREKAYNEVAYPSSLSQNHKRIISVLAGYLGLMESYDNNLILIKRRNLIHDPSPLLRSQSHSAIPLLSQQNLNQSQSNQRYRQQNGPLQPNGPHRLPPNFSLGLSNSNNSLSSAALLRNNPTPTRVMPNLYNQQSFYQQQQPQAQPPQSANANVSQQAQQTQPSAAPQQSFPPQQSQSQPTTPGLDPMSRFNLGGNANGSSNQWTEESYGGSNSSNENDLNESLNGLNLGLDNGSNIWGPRSSSSSQQPAA